jgi:hypothetical protein
MRFEDLKELKNRKSLKVEGGIHRMESFSAVGVVNLINGYLCGRVRCSV